MKVNPTLLKAHLALGFVALIYGINYFTLKVVFNEGHNSFAILAMRSLIAASFFILFHAIAIREKVTSRKDLFRLFLCGMFGISINQTFFLWGLSNTSPVNAAVLMVTTPVFVFLVAWLMKQETITLRKIVGLLISCGGAIGLILMGAKGGITISGTSISGDLMIMANAASYGIYLVLVRPLVLKYNTFTIVKWIFLFGAVPNIALGIVPLSKMDLSGANSEVWFGLIFLLLFATIVVYFLNAWALKNVQSSAVGVYIYFQPVFVTLISLLLAKGEVSWVKFQFILLIFAGVYLVTTKSNKQRRQKEAVES